MRPLSKILSKRNIQTNDSNKSILSVVNSYYDGLVQKVTKLKEIKPIKKIKAETLDTNLHTKSQSSILNTIHSYYDGLVEKIQDQYSSDKEYIKMTYSSLSNDIDLTNDIDVTGNKANTGSSRTGIKANTGSSRTDQKICMEFKEEIYNRACKVENLYKKSMDESIEDFSKNFFDYLVDRVNLQTESDCRAITEITEENHQKFDLDIEQQINEPLDNNDINVSKQSDQVKQSLSNASESIEEAKAVAFSFFGELISNLNFESSRTSLEKKQDDG